MEKVIINTETQEVIFEPLSEEELLLKEKEIKMLEAKAAEAAAKEAARQALLDKLGITADEAKLLLG